MNLSEISSDELRKEIERREIVSTMPKLRLVPAGDGLMFELQNLCQSYIDSLAGEKYFKDAENHIFEAAITTFYGADVWDWINERVE